VRIGDILRNNVKEKLERDEVVASMTVRLVRTPEIARIASTAGFDTLYVDMEHSTISLEACAAICMATLEAGIAPFVRVPANTPDHIARVLEGGALGIIAPHVHSLAGVTEVVRAAKFPPLGERSNVSGLPHLHFRSFPVSRSCIGALNRRPQQDRKQESRGHGFIRAYPFVRPRQAETQQLRGRTLRRFRHRSRKIGKEMLQ